MAPKTDKAQDAPSPQESPASKPGKSPTTFSPRTVAVYAAKTFGRDVTDKRVRSVARDVLPRFIASESGGERSGYTAHRYTADEVQTLIGAMSGKGRGAPSGTLEDLSAALSSEAGAEAEGGAS